MIILRRKLNENGSASMEKKISFKRTGNSAEAAAHLIKGNLAGTNKINKWPPKNLYSNAEKMAGKKSPLRLWERSSQYPILSIFKRHLKKKRV